MMAKYVKSTIKLNIPRINQITNAAVVAMSKTAEALHTDIVQSQVIPRDTGNLQNESTFVDYSESEQGKTYIVSSTPYARRLYFHPELHFSKDENPNAKGRWMDDYLEGGSKEDFCKDTFKKIFKRTAGV